MEEEYYWAITQAEGRSRCGRSGPSVMKCGFELNLLVYTYVTKRVVNSDSFKVRILSDLPQRNYYGVSWEVPLLLLLLLLLLLSLTPF